MTWIIISLVAAGASILLFLGRKWGLAVGKKRAAKALQAQKAELILQQKAFAVAAKQNKSLQEKITKAKTAKEAADVLQEINTSWNSGK